MFGLDWPRRRPPMPTPVNYNLPTVIYPPRSTLPPPLPVGQDVSVPPLVVRVPDGRDLLSDGEIFDQILPVSMVVTKIQADIPEGVTAYLELDGSRIHETNDRKGNVGSLDTGDLAAGTGLTVRRAVFHAENTSGQDLQARYFLTGMPS